MTGERALLLALGVGVGGLLLARGWRSGLALLAGVVVCVAAFVRNEPLTARGLPASRSMLLLLAVELSTAATVLLILLVTGLTYSRGARPEELDERGQLELRRSERFAAKLNLPRGWSDYLLPVLAVVLALTATVLLPDLYPFASEDADYAWTLLILGGALLLVVAATLLKIALGLLLLMFGLKLFYLRTADPVGLIELALLNLVTIVLALIAAYLSSLLYARLKTLDLDTLLRGR